MVTELLRDPAEEELGLVEGVDLVMRAGQNGPLSPAVGSRSGCPTRNQLSLGVPAEPSFAIATVGGSHHYVQSGSSDCRGQGAAQQEAGREKCGRRCQSYCEEASRYGSKQHSYTV
jgi:hypothetical protein